MRQKEWKRGEKNENKTDEKRNADEIFSYPFQNIPKLKLIFENKKKYETVKKSKK